MQRTPPFNAPTSGCPRRLDPRRLLQIGTLVLGLAVGCGGSTPPSTTSSTTTAQIEATTATDRLNAILAAAWQKQGISPAPPADDATFLRRVTLDLWGELPAPEAIERFAADKAPDKRARLVTSMVQDSKFADRFAAVWTDVLLPGGGPKQGVDRAAFRAWLAARMRENKPWNEIVRAIVGGSGAGTEGGRMKERAIATQTTAAEAESPDVHGEVNYLLRYRGQIEDLAGKTSRAFLGIQIQCAQCHDHKTEAWTTAQFRGFAAAFAKTRAVPVGDKEKGDMRAFEVRDVAKARLGPKAPESAKKIAEMRPTALDGSALDPGAPRQDLAKWITSGKNPTFAKAFVNRTWAQLLGAGFVEPVDDLRPSNPPVLPEALDFLSEELTNNGFDVRHLVATICTSDAYQRAAGPEKPLWAAFALRPLPADVLFDAYVTATGIAPVLEEVAGERAAEIRARARHRFSEVLDVDEESGPGKFEGSVSHELLLSNGAATRVGTAMIEGNALERVVHGTGTDESKVDALYVRTISRHATPEEQAFWKRALDEADAAGFAKQARSEEVGSKKVNPLGKAARRLRSTAKTGREQGYEDLFWALLLTSEMALQH